MMKIYEIFKYNGIQKGDPVTLQMIIEKIKRRDNNRVCYSISGHIALQSCQNRDIDKIKKLWKNQKKPYKQQSKRCRRIVREVLS